MKKDAYYFPHFSNARNDSKLIRLRRILGVEGYGLYFMLLEILREQKDFKYPLLGIEDLAFEWHTSKEKLFTIINDFGLFEVIDEQFFSPNLVMYLQPYIEKSQRAREAALNRWEKVNAKSIEVKASEPQVYVIACYNKEELFIKIGSTTTTVARRFSSKLPYKYILLAQVFTDNHMQLESEYDAKFKENSYEPKLSFPGLKECYNVDALSDILNYKPLNDYSQMLLHYSGNAEQLKNKCFGNASKVKESKVKENKRKENTYRAFMHLHISEEENKKLLDLGYKQEKIDEILDSIENYSKNKQYKSLYLTAKNWLKKDVEKSPTIIRVPKPKPFEGYK